MDLRGTVNGPLWRCRTGRTPGLHRPPLFSNLRKVSFGYEEGRLRYSTGLCLSSGSSTIAGPTGGKTALSADTGFGFIGKGTHRLTTDDGRTRVTPLIYASTSSMCPKEMRCWRYHRENMAGSGPGADEEALKSSGWPALNLCSVCRKD